VRSQRVAEAAARAGGAVLMARLRGDGDLQIAYKDGRANLVTVADRESQQAVTDVIRAAFPDHAVVGEEGTTGDPGTEHVWYVDPLDGRWPGRSTTRPATRCSRRRWVAAPP